MLEPGGSCSSTYLLTAELSGRHRGMKHVICGRSEKEDVGRMRMVSIVNENLHKPQRVDSFECLPDPSHLWSPFVLQILSLLFPSSLSPPPISITCLGHEPGWQRCSHGKRTCGLWTAPDGGGACHASHLGINSTLWE